MLGEDVLYLSATELAARIKSRALSPVELTESYLDRSRRLGPKLNAYVTMTEDLALRQARQAEAEIAAGRYRGPLHGIPYAAKDLLAVAGYPTTWGAKPYANQKFDFNATVIQRLNDAGAVLIGKAAMIELAGGMGYRFASAALTGPARNPWNTQCWTCGSSSGSGAIVSSALAAFAIGTETWGSIICPSAFCGVSGLRPTYGRVSRHGAMALSYSMDKIGPMCRAAQDCGLVLQAIAAHDPQDAASLPPALAAFSSSDTGTRGAAKSSAAGKRIGWISQWKTNEKAQAAERAAHDAALLLGQHGYLVEDAQLPEGPWEAAAGTLISVEGASAFDALITSGRVSELADPLGKIGGYVSQVIPGTDFVRAMRARGILQKKMAEMFQQYDLLASPSEPVGATTLDTNLETGLDFPDPLGAIGNLCGLPALSVPCGFDERHVPLGVQFVGPVLADADVAAAAIAYQQNTKWHLQRPAVE